MAVPQRIITEIGRRYEVLRGVYTERELRLWAGAEAMALDSGGISAVANATGLSRNTVRAGLEELRAPETRPSHPAVARDRRRGGGRKPIEESTPGIVEALNQLVDPVTRGDPESPLRWTSKSAKKLADELTEQKHPASESTVRRLLQKQGFSLQGNAKTSEGGKDPDRDAQFQFIAEEVQSFHAAGQPVISVDCKKKELVGAFRNAGREYQPKGQPEEVNVYDFPNLAEGKAVPYGVYDVLSNEGWVSVGISAETAEFAVDTIECWLKQMGEPRYGRIERLLITADSGGSNAARSRLFKRELQRFADQHQIAVTVHHLPPGTSKWNKIEHRLFSHITMNWRGRPLVSFETLVECIGSTRTQKGLRVDAALTEKIYERGIKVSDDELKRVMITRNEFRGDWNYTISPRIRNTEQK